MTRSHFEWDDAKDRANQAKHDVPFHLARLAFSDPHRVIDRFETRFPHIDLLRGPRFVEVPEFATAGGLTAGIDLSLRVVERLFDRKVAQKTADELEYTGTGWKV